MSDPIGYNGSYVDDEKVIRWMDEVAEIRKQRAKANGDPRYKDAQGRQHTHPWQEGGRLHQTCEACAEEMKYYELEGLARGHRPTVVNIPQFSVVDTGKRESFASGMVRNNADDKVDYTSVLDGPMLDRWAAHLTKAKKLYPDIAPGVANWTQANSEEELVRFKKSALRHFIQWLRGEEEEDHAAAVFFNINGAALVQNKLRDERSRESMGDRTLRGRGNNPDK